MSRKLKSIHDGYIQIWNKRLSPEDISEYYSDYSTLHIKDCISSQWEEVFQEIAQLKNIKSMVIESYIENYADEDWSKLQFIRKIQFPDSKDPTGPYLQLNKERAQRLSKLVDIQRLALPYCTKDQQLIYILCSPLRNLLWLDLSRCQITDITLQKICFSLCNLTSLRLYESHITDLGVKLLCKNMRKLQQLRLGDNMISDEGAAAIATLPSLRILDLSENRVGGEGVDSILKMLNIKELIVYRNLIMPMSLLRLLVRMAKLKNITSDLRHNSVVKNLSSRRKLKLECSLLP